MSTRSSSIFYHKKKKLHRCLLNKENLSSVEKKNSEVKDNLGLYTNNHPQ